MAKVRDGGERYSGEIRLHYKVLAEAMEENGVHWDEPAQQSDLAPSGTSAQESFKFKMPAESTMAALPPAPVARSRPEPVPADVSSAIEDPRRQEAAVPIAEEAKPTVGQLHLKGKQTEHVTSKELEAQLPEVFQLQTREDVMWKLQRLGPGPAQDTVLEILEATNAALRQATSLEQVRRISSIAEVLRACTKELAMSKAIQDNATAFSIRSEYRANELLQRAREQGELSVGTRGQLKGRTTAGEPNISKPSSASGMSQDPPPEKSTLAEAGIDKNFAKRIRRWGDLSREDLEARIEEKRAEGKLTKIAVLSDFGTPKREPKPHQPLLNFLRDLEKHPEHYAATILVSDSELRALYDQLRTKFLELIEKLEQDQQSLPSSQDRLAQVRPAC
jgi:hypothetical protein